MNKKQSEAVHTIVGNSQRHQIIELMLVILHIYNVQYKLVLRTLFFFLSVCHLLSMLQKYGFRDYH